MVAQVSNSDLNWRALKAKACADYTAQKEAAAQQVFEAGMNPRPSKACATDPSVGGARCRNDDASRGRAGDPPSRKLRRTGYASGNRFAAALIVGARASAPRARRLPGDKVLASWDSDESGDL